jgi:hypothetical protein
LALFRRVKGISPPNLSMHSWEALSIYSTKKELGDFDISKVELLKIT